MADIRGPRRLSSQPLSARSAPLLPGAKALLLAVMFCVVLPVLETRSNGRPEMPRSHNAFSSFVGLATVSDVFLARLQHIVIPFF